jgi:hypothetical protein
MAHKWNAYDKPEKEPESRNPRRCRYRNISVNADDSDCANELQSIMEKRLGAKMALGYVIGLAVREKLEREKAIAKTQRPEPREYRQLPSKPKRPIDDQGTPSFVEEA